jgi:plastocyanin
MMLRARVAAAVPVLFALLAACGGGSSGGSSVSSGSSTNNNSSSGMKTIAGVDANFHGEENVAGKSALTVEADSFYFEPSVLKGTAGQKLTLTIENHTSTPHNFSIEAQHINSDLDANGKKTVTVTFPSSGVLSFFCEYHKSQGMAGGLLVSGPFSGSSNGGSSSSPSSGGNSGYTGY